MAGNKLQGSFMDRISDVVVTLVCWFYFIFAFLLFFSFFYLAAFFFARDRERAFQYLDHLFFKGFFWLLRTLVPRHIWEIDRKIREIHGAIIVCNHLSYLDPLLLISQLPQNKTIVKTKFFHAPVFGWLLKVSGYLPATTEGAHAKRMIAQVENMGSYFKNGGNLFVFPEGTRNTASHLGDFHRGVFKIARMYRCPVHVLSLCNSDKLFTPGKFFFNTRVHNHIRMKSIGCLDPGVDAGRISAAALEKKVRQIFESDSSCMEGGR